MKNDWISFSFLTVYVYFDTKVDGQYTDMDMDMNTDIDMELGNFS